MEMAEEMARLVREVIASYEARLSSVEQIIESAHEMLDAFRGEREAIRVQLRETLARAASLRKRDFDAMMHGVLAHVEAREQAAKETIKRYLQEQWALAASLKRVLADDGTDQVGVLRELLKDIAVHWEERQREVRTLLAEFQSEQEDLARALGGLLADGASVRVKEFQTTLRAMRARSLVGRAR